MPGGQRAVGHRLVVFGEVFLAVVHAGLDGVAPWFPARRTDCGERETRESQEAATRRVKAGQG